MAFIFDTHLHISTVEDTDKFFADAREAGCRGFLLAGTSRKDTPQIMSLCSPGSGIFAAVGQHPGECVEYTPQDRAYYLECHEHPGVVAVGEIGLDYFYDADTADVQKKVFAEFLELAAALRKPPMIHCREAFDDCYDLVRRHYGIRPEGLIIHSFTGTPDQADKWLEQGAYLSCNGMVTFKNAGNIRESLSHIPVDRLLLETDSPYLAPVPFRGKPNTSAYLPYIAARAAEVKDLDTETLIRKTTENALRVFGIAGSPAAEIFS